MLEAINVHIFFNSMSAPALVLQKACTKAKQYDTVFAPKT